MELVRDVPYFWLIAISYKLLAISRRQNSRRQLVRRLSVPLRSY